MKDSILFFYFGICAKLHTKDKKSRLYHVLAKVEIWFFHRSDLIRGLEQGTWRKFGGWEVQSSWLNVNWKNSQFSSQKSGNKIWSEWIIIILDLFYFH
jgi:hypothetical protein